MKLNVSQQALKWFSKEFQLNNQEKIRLFPRYGGLGESYKGYTVGISIEKPIDCGIEFPKKESTFFVEQVDLWFFEECSLNLEIEVDELKISIKEKQLLRS